MATKILIADDSPTVQKKASGVLMGEGMEVVTVSNGVAAIKKLPTVKPMVILADVSMPGKDGYEVCEFVKASPDFINVPVVLVFSDDDIYDEEKGARAQADGRIRKPFDPAELIATVTKFAALAEAASKPKVAAPVITPPRPPAVVSEPTDEEPESFTTPPPPPDFAQFGSGFAFAEPAQEEVQAPAAEPPPAYESAAAPESDFVVSHDQPPLLDAEPPPAEDLIIEAEAPIAFEPPPEPAAEMPSPSIAEPEQLSSPVEPDSPPTPSEPVFIEEEVQALPPPPPRPPVIAAAERTVMFRIPADIAQPVFRDESAPAAAPPPIDAPAAEDSSEVTAEESARMVSEGDSTAAVLEAAPEAADETPPVSATTLESYSLSEAAAGHVRFAPSDDIAEEEAAATGEVPAPESPEAQTPVESMADAPMDDAIAAAPAEVTLEYDPALIYSIVYRVVAKMSPRMPSEMIESMSRNLSDEISAEINSPPPENL